MTVIGLELGGTWIRAVSVDVVRGVIKEQRRVRTPVDPRQAVLALGNLWEQLGSSPMVGFAAAARLDDGGRILRWPNAPQFEGTNILAAFSRCEATPFVLDDVSAAAVAEHFLLTEDETRPSSSVLISVGTGVGAGLVLSDRLWTGVRGMAMELGHIPVPAAEGVLCTCGSKGCLQTVVSGRVIDRLCMEYGIELGSAAFRAAKGDPVATEILSTLCTPLAQAILVVARLLDPNRVILGGGLAEGGTLRRCVEPMVEALGCEVPILNGKWGTWAGAVGVAMEVSRHTGSTSFRVRPKRRQARFSFALVQGPNLNLLGERETEHYGTVSSQEVERRMLSLADRLGCQLCSVQANHEGVLVEWLQARRGRLDGIIVNPASLTARGYGLRDILTALDIPFIEVHLSNIHAREEWHRESCFADVASGRITGFGVIGYELALKSLVNRFSKGPS